MKGLALIVEGLVKGMWTLIWAMLLLLFIIYIMGLLMLTIVTGNPRETDDYQNHVLPQFQSLGHSMLTLYRCAIGDCATNGDIPLIPLLNNTYGVFFTAPWLMSMMFVTFGLFNLILGVFVESTLETAKFRKDAIKDQKEERIKVAQHIKKLLRKFCIAQKMVDDGKCLSGETIRNIPMVGKEDDFDDFEIKISKDTFLQVVQDLHVQQLMNELRICTDRARLFEVFNTNRSDTLTLRQLVQGLLRVRGETRKSDVLAAVLGIRAVADQILEIESNIVDMTSALENMRDVELELKASQDTLELGMDGLFKRLAGIPHIGFTDESTTSEVSYESFPDLRVQAATSAGSLSVCCI